MAPPSTRLLTTLVALAVASSYATPARASFMITGDPTTDMGWGVSVGNSLASGNYIRGDGNFSFDMYRAQFLVGDVTGLQPATLWGAGDSVIAMGGVIVTTLSDFPVTTGDTVGTNLSGSVRIVSKFTNSGGGFIASNVAPGMGDGQGNFSAGDGGIGSILIATVTNTATTTQQVTAAGANTLTLAGINQRWDGSGTPSVSSQHARFIYKVDGSGKLKSWEVLLNVSSLTAELPSNTIVPEWGGRWDQALQRGTKKFTDGLNLAPLPPPAAARRSFLASDLEGEGDGEPPALATPLPPTLVALAAGAGLLGLGRRLRRAA